MLKSHTEFHNYTVTVCQLKTKFKTKAFFKKRKEERSGQEDMIFSFEEYSLTAKSKRFRLISASEMPFSELSIAQVTHASNLSVWKLRRENGVWGSWEYVEYPRPASATLWGPVSNLKKEKKDKKRKALWSCSVGKRGKQEAQPLPRSPETARVWLSLAIWRIWVKSEPRFRLERRPLTLQGNYFCSKQR